MNLRKLRTLAVGNIDRIIAVVCIGVLSYGIVTKGIEDIIFLIENNPGEFWPSFLKYILRNLSTQ